MWRLLSIAFILLLETTRSAYAEIGAAKYRSSVDRVDGQYIIVMDTRPATGSGVVQPRADILAGKYRALVRAYYQNAFQGFSAALAQSDALLLSQDTSVQWVQEVSYTHLVGGSEAVSPNYPNLDRIDQRTLPYDSTYFYPLSGYKVFLYVVDSGIRASHNEFWNYVLPMSVNNRIIAGADFVGDGNGTNDCFGHGTAVASIAAGLNSGVSKDSYLVPVRVANCSGSGDTSQLISGIDWIIANHYSPAVVNMSLVVFGGDAGVDAALGNLQNTGVIQVAAAGNDSADACNNSPGRNSWVLTVGALTNSDYQTVASISNQGSCVKVFAPGGNFYAASSSADNAMTYLSGSFTSYAAPHAAGIAAMYLSGNPNASPSATLSTIVSNATPGVISAGLTSGSPNLLLYSRFPVCTANLSYCQESQGTGSRYVCRNLANDPDACGSCGTVCGSGSPYCVAGQCRSCPGGTTDCCFDGQYCRATCTGFQCP